MILLNSPSQETPAMKEVVRKAIGKVWQRPDHLVVDGSVIPSTDRRRCGPEYKNHAFYLRSTEAEARRLINHLQCDKSSRILDIGCGQGRLPIGLLRVIGEVDYLGIDLDQKCVDWCQRHIERRHPSYKFQRLDLYNERYNPGGVVVDEQFQFEVASGSVDIVNLYSVFSHTDEAVLRAYLKDFARMLGEKGRVFFTTFIEDDVPDMSVNPENYRMVCSGAYHVVRWRKEYLFAILKEYGFSIVDFTYASEIDGQSAVYLQRP